MAKKKRCRTCKKAKPRKDFGIDKSMGDGLRADCRPCRGIYERERFAKLPTEEKERRRKATEVWRKKNPEKYKASYINSVRKAKYGLTVQAYQQMLIDQDGRCAICRRFEIAKSNGKDIDNLAVDHDHVTGQVRGLLCGNCNKGIGNLQDSPAILEAAALYLRRYGKP